MQGAKTPLKVPPLRVLVVGEDESIREWVRAAFKKAGVPARLRLCCPLRVCAPENNLAEQDVIVVLWEHSSPVTMDEILARTSITERSSESVLCDIETNVGESKLRRTVAVGRHITREDAVFLAEYHCKLVFPLPEKASQWEAEGIEFVKRLLKVHDSESDRARTPEELAIQRFRQLLSCWERISDEAKMEATEGLLRALGDSSRYAELVAQKCLKEHDTLGAEQWLRRSISKNPNYLHALQMLADLHMQTGHHADALPLLEKLKANNQRNFHRLTKIGKCHFALGEYAKAEKAFSDALAIDEFYPEAREELGKVKCVLGDYTSAKTLLSRSNNGRKLATFLNAVGIRLVEQRRFPESIEHYKKAQYVLPGNDSSHLLFFNIGLAYAKWGKITEAVKYIRLALIREPCYDRAATLLKSLQERGQAA
jgi:tetratricopeptide (TPR) repeat protein